MRITFLGQNFREKIYDKDIFLRLLFQTKILGKNIFNELFGPYSKKPPGPGGEGVQGRGTWGVCPGML